MEQKIRMVCAIDPGVHTGFAVTVNGDLTDVETYTFTEAQAWLLNCSAYADPEKQGCCTLELVIEDPRGQYVPYNQREPQRIKGVGSVERDTKLWIEFAEYYKIPYRTMKPGKYRKIDAKTFAKITGWNSRTSEHARAAAMMVFEKQRTK